MMGWFDYNEPSAKSLKKWHHDYNEPSAERQVLLNTLVIALVLAQCKAVLPADVFLINCIVLAARVGVTCGRMALNAKLSPRAVAHTLTDSVRYLALGLPTVAFDFCRYGVLVWYHEGSKNQKIATAKLALFGLLAANTCLLPASSRAQFLAFEEGAPLVVAMGWFKSACDFTGHCVVYVHCVMAVVSFAFNLKHIDVVRTFFANTMWKHKVSTLHFSILESVVLGCNSNMLRVTLGLVANSLHFSPRMLDISPLPAIFLFVNLIMNTVTQFTYESIDNYAAGCFYTHYDMWHTEFHKDRMRYFLYHAQHHFTLPVMGISNAGDGELLFAELLHPATHTLKRPIDQFFMHVVPYPEHNYFPNHFSKKTFNTEYMHMEHHFGRVQPLQLTMYSDYSTDYERKNNAGLWEQLHLAAEKATGTKDFDATVEAKTSKRY
eukprot:CAMPEP_0195572286 /NCGR_PEP_ID=MMETSP0814-20130614/4639_1 /TAXON_ID=97485 /ORGANISM="Prymnesium parvum, Strain Texoma1" /LENGTH=434 /DNA_ID=CAMNT_0040708035 /DNA_START=45 /DNA_END=1349 /DNA_ORIENTATION=-